MTTDQVRTLLVDAITACPDDFAHGGCLAAFAGNPDVRQVVATAIAQARAEGVVHGCRECAFQAGVPLPEPAGLCVRDADAADRALREAEQEAVRLRDHHATEHRRCDAWLAAQPASKERKGG